MAKLKLKQKEWLTLKEAAEFLSNVADGPKVKPSDIIQYALENELVLSLRTLSCTDAPILCADLVAADELSEEERNSFEKRFLGDSIRERGVFRSFVNGKLYYGDYIQEFTLPPSTSDLNVDPVAYSYFLTIVWDKVRRNNFSDERVLEAEALTMEVTDHATVDSHPFIELIGAGGTMVSSLPIHMIPPGSLLMVRVDRLHGLFENEINENLKPSLSTKEKKTYLKVIRALCEDHKDIDLGQHSTAAGQLTAMADTLGLTIPSKRTLENLLKEARDLED